MNFIGKKDLLKEESHPDFIRPKELVFGVFVFIK